ncbi:DUF1286 domain-containing protein [Metallosphaera hakonensis]|uniref:Conjugal transfer protein n=1 Tax=Metallosphaera hakonensis JCM 8857 = DSM 7519 TaxID=1293036 RepID=A0A2U9IXH7_9CREN|nr:DUF1286 domain-containing protein [Metallosphaera hakonensis]AWS00704.1 DUF1286 domain-containing protein [Metallosphaera hakonensis JCM 8857 = DSM 7519]
MKLVTHYVFTTGILTIMATPFLGFYSGLIFSFIISWVSNTLIDRLGHETRGGYIRRTPRTHTLFRSIPWGLIPAVPIAILGGDLPIMVLGVIAGPSHMLLDVFTERGIYVKRCGKWKRLALAHFSYNNPLVNGIAIVIGALLLYLALQVQDQSVLTVSHLLQ